MFESFPERSEERQPSQIDGWQRKLRSSFWMPAELLKRLKLPLSLCDQLPEGWQKFPIQATESYLRKIKEGHEEDPLFLQIWPRKDEENNPSGFQDDCVGEFQKYSGGLIHKYEGRALHITTSACAIHCRYCFRKEFPYENRSLSVNGSVPQPQSNINEIIFSGGDPFVLLDEKLVQRVDPFLSAPHIKTLRFHTRILSALSDRITQKFLDMLREWQSEKTVVIVHHFNHEREIGEEEGFKCKLIAGLGVTQFNQSVLLKGINDTYSSLERLSWKLIESHIVPYYLHQLDKVSGTAHFEVDPTIGRELIAEMRERLPGYLVPRYVQEIAGAGSKVPLEIQDF